MKLYRATSKKSESGIPAGSCWTPDIEVARAYQNNPGFGGKYLREIEIEDESILDITGGLHKLAEALGYDDPRETASDWHFASWRYPWEESSEVARRLRKSGYQWLRYEDDYPDGAITMMRIK